jgi:hypothetical protein
MTTENKQKCPADNWRFGAMAAVARRNGSAILEISFPPEPLWKPPLRQAAGSLGDTRTEHSLLKNNKNNIKSL